MFVFKREVNTVHIDPIAHILKYFLIYNIYNYCIHVEDYRRFRFRSITCQWLLIMFKQDGIPGTLFENLADDANA